MVDYLNLKKSHVEAKTSPEPRDEPVLSEEDEAFLHHITSGTDEIPPPLPARHTQDLAVAGDSTGNDAQVALMNSAQNIPLPDVPDSPEVFARGEIPISNDKGKGKVKHGKNVWSFLRRDSRDRKRKAQKAAGMKGADAQPNEDGLVTPNEAKKEEDEMTNVLEQLNLAAVNNRVFSLSDESQVLLRKSVPTTVIDAFF